MMNCLAMIPQSVTGISLLVWLRKSPLYVLLVIYSAMEILYLDTYHLSNYANSQTKIWKQSLLVDDAPFGGSLHVAPSHYGGAMMRQLISNSHIVKSVHATARPHKAASHNIQTGRQYHPLTASTSKYTQWSSDTHHAGLQTVIQKTQNPIWDITDKHFC